MKFLEPSVGIGFSLIFLVWVICMISWVKRGMPIPRYIHVLAVTLTFAGGAFLAFALVGGFFDWKLGLGCLALPAPATYFSWLWMFGSEFSRESQGGAQTTRQMSREQDAA
ncbi:MAG: cyanate permease [Verrucomicrobiales bacterium]|jgi:cyanate permease